MALDPKNFYAQADQPKRANIYAGHVVVGQLGNTTAVETWPIGTPLMGEMDDLSIWTQASGFEITAFLFPKAYDTSTTGETAATVMRSGIIDFKDLGEIVFPLIPGTGFTLEQLRTELKKQVYFDRGFTIRNITL